MNIFQKAYDFIKGIKTPLWLKELLGALQTLMFDIAKKAGEDYVAYIEQCIVEAANNVSLNNQQKFDYVFNKAKSGGITALVVLRDREIECLIQFLYTQYRKLKGE